MAARSRCWAPAGSGQLTKMVNQICIAGLVQGLSEGIAFAENAKLDPLLVLDVISKGAAQSWQMENRGKTMHERKFNFGFAVDWMRKDLGICLEEAKRNGAKLPVTQTRRRLLRRDLEIRRQPLGHVVAHHAALGGSTMSIKLYYAPGACSLASHIASRTSGLPYETRAHQSSRKATSASPSTSRSIRAGRVPTVVVDGKVLTENVGILTYFAGGYPKANIWPKDTWHQAKAISTHGVALQHGAPDLRAPPPPGALRGRRSARRRP